MNNGVVDCYEDEEGRVHDLDNMSINTRFLVQGRRGEKGREHRRDRQGREHDGKQGQDARRARDIAQGTSGADGL